jgi:predicted metal-dependent HD superfamily phosphohydrolase
MSKLEKILEKYGVTISLNEILERWKESHRGYHNLEHLKDLLKQIGKVDTKEKELLVLVALFHDIIYEPKNKDNEEQSADFFLKNVKEKTEDIQKVYQSIVDTKHHKSSNKLSEIFNKMDMDIVTRDFDELIKWENGIRKEYSIFSDKDYKKGRIEFLKTLINDYPENKENILKLIEYVSNNLNENLNLKSRAKKQEQEKEEFINNILSKGIRNLTGNDFAKIIELDDNKKELFFNELIKEFGNDFDYEIEKNSITFDISGKINYGRNFRFNVPTIYSFNFSYSTLERRNLLNGVSYTAPKRIFDSVKTFDELIKKGNEILNKPMIVENLNESNSRQEKFTTFANKVAEKMGIDSINYLDSGFFGSAFDIGENKILKITTDKSEALNAKKIKGKDTHFIAKVYDVRGFKFEGVEYYFIILEKVQTDFEYLNGIIENLISWFDENNDEDFIDFITGSKFENLKEIEVDLYNDNKQLYNYFTNFVELKKELIKYNITSSDFINGTNLGFRGKRIVAFDLGISDDDGELENFDLFEVINLRSRVKDIEKEKEELSKEILQKNIEDFTKNDVQFLISANNFENFLEKLKLYFDEFFKNEKHESLIKSSTILPVLKLKFIDRPRLGYNNILHIGFDILFKNQFYVEKFDGIGVDSGRYFDNITELLDYVKDTYKKKVYESLILKSKVKEHEKEGLDFYINKIKGNKTLYYIPENIFKNLPNDVKLKYIDKMVNEVGYRLYQNEFDASPDEIKIKYIEMIEDKGWNLSEYEKKWVEFNNSSDENKIKNIKKLIDNGLSLTEFQKKWFKENKEKFNFEIRNLMKLDYPDWFTNNSIKEGLNLKSRAKDNKEELFSFLREEGINDYTLTFLDNKNYKYNDLPKDIQSMIFGFFEELMENLHREDDIQYIRKAINRFFPIWVFKLLPDEFKEDIIDFMIKCDMGLTKIHFEYATDSQKDFYIEKVLEFRELYSWEKEYEDNKYFKERGINEGLNLKSRAGDEEHNKERKEYYLKKFEEDSLGYSNESIPKDLINDRKIFKEYLNYLVKHNFDMLDREFFYLNDGFKIIYLNKKEEIGKRLLSHEIRWMKKMDIEIKEGINIKSRTIEIKKKRKKLLKIF